MNDFELATHPFWPSIRGLWPAEKREEIDKLAEAIREREEYEREKVLNRLRSAQVRFGAELEEGAARLRELGFDGERAYRLAAVVPTVDWATVSVARALIEHRYGRIELEPLARMLRRPSEQFKLYVDCLRAEHGEKPVVAAGT